MKFISALLIVSFSLASALPFDVLPEAALEAELNKELDHYIKTREVGSLLKELAQELDLRGILSNQELQDDWNEPKISLFCTACHTAFNRVLNGNVTNNVFTTVINLCLDLGIGNQVLCEGLITQSEPSIIWISQNVENETANDICGVLFVGQGCTSNDEKREWSVTLPNTPKPPISEPPYPQNPSSTLTVLHLADTHFDPNYMPGSNAVCPETVFCCNSASGVVLNPEDAAGYWGDYRNCDLPLWTLKAMYQSIADSQADIDFIIWTGDIVPHIVWDTSRQGNLAVINEMAELIRTYFPGVPVYPAVGNHEADPLNLFSQPDIPDTAVSMAWLYSDLANLWSYWLPANTVQDILYSAYYSTPVRAGLKIVSLNTNWCYGANWWLIYDSTDIANELDFLAKALQASEDIGESVYIIGHIPPGHSSCQLTWSREFNRIISRYEDTVTGMFYGHTHKDHFELFFDPDDSTRAYDIAYIGQSQTTYANLNPGYKIYTIEGDFSGTRYRVLDHDNYIMNLDQANLVNDTSFFRQYRASDEYKMTDLSPQSWLDVVNQMLVPNSTIFDTFYNNYVKGGTPSVEKGCNDNCKNRILCGLLVSDNSDHSQCTDLGIE